MIITAGLLQSAIGCTRERAELFAPHLDAGCQAYQIDTPRRLAHFLAQVAHESGSLAYVREVWGPTAAQQRYEGRADLGNTQAGDGRFYLGRGLLQTTGRSNYRSLRDRLRQRGIDCPDFETNPETLELPRWAVLSACDYWEMRGINRLADRGDFEGVTRAVNGGINGIEDRQRRLERATSVLAAMPEDTPGVQLGPEPAPTTAPRPDQEPYTSEATMPIPAIVTALLPTVVQMIPRLASIFKPGSEVAERNVAAATAVIDLVTSATGAVNAQAAVDAIQSNPEALAAATKAVESKWFELAPADGGGIDGARKADAAAVANDGPWFSFLKSPSFWMLVLSLPLVYIVVGSIAGLWGYVGWSDDVRASLATAVVSLIIGGSAGYFWGQTTSRNRTPVN